MYNPQLIWYNKKDVLEIFPITERTYFRRLKKITPEIRIKNFKNRKGKPTTLIHYQDLNKIFKRKRKPSNLKDPNIFRKYIGTKQWDFIGNIVPEKTTKNELIEKMNFLHSQLKLIDNEISMFYSLEKNTKDNYFHSHFLIKTELDKNSINSELTNICNVDLKTGKRIDLSEYDFNRFQFRGSFYSNKSGGFDIKNHSQFIYSEYLK
jgi:hypothetical protein